MTFFLVTQTKINLEEFLSQFYNLKLSTTSGTTVKFLDLNISINFITNTLNFKLFITHKLLTYLVIYFINLTILKLSLKTFPNHFL